MTAHRRPEIPFSDVARGICRWCGEAILHEAGPMQGEPNLRRRWHPACLDAYEGTDPREARRRVRKRDRGICVLCRVDTNRLRRELRGPGMTRALRKRGFKPRKSLWELDHIVPLIDGGSHDDSNLQTLCTPCHKQKTALEARVRAAARAAEAAEVAEKVADEVAAGIAAEAAVAAPADVKADARPTSAGPRRARAATARSLDALLDDAAGLNARVETLLRELRSSASR